MLRPLRDMPTGTIGFEAVGEIDDDDFGDAVEPILRQEIALGRKIRLLYVLGPALKKYEGDAIAEDMKFAARHPTAYERVAIVSDEDWLRPAVRVLSVLVPGQLRGFPVAELQAAKSWIAADLGEEAAAAR